MLARVIATGAAIFGPVGGLWLWIDSRFAKKHSVANQLHVVTNELSIHRSYFKDLFEKLEQHARRDEESFRHIADKMSSNHAEVLRALGDKADRR